MSEVLTAIVRLMHLSERASIDGKQEQCRDFMNAALYLCSQYHITIAQVAKAYDEDRLSRDEETRP